MKTAKDIRRENLGILVFRNGRKSGQVKEFAIAHDLSPAHVSQMLNGHRAMGDEVARRIEDAQHLVRGWMDTAHHSVSETLAGYRLDNARHAGEETRELPVISYVQAGTWSDATDPYAKGQGMDYIAVDADLARSLSRSSFALVIEGDSMLDLFQPGDVVVIDPEVAPLPGDFVVAKLEREDRATFKKYREKGLGSDGHMEFDLVPLNSDYPVISVNSNFPASVIGVMVEHRRRRRSR